jgi:U3 small nucleolar RNA-associated protein 15
MLYHLRKEQVISTIDNFKSIISSITYRPDGKIMAIGEESGFVQILETKRRNQLRQFKKHTKAVHALVFGPNEGSSLYTASDDLVDFSLGSNI